MDSVIEALVVKRVYPHSREIVFKAWTEAIRLERWFCPNPNNRVKAEIDLRVGGRYKIAMIPPQGDAWVVGGVYREIITPSLLTFTWHWAHEDEESVVTVHFHEVEVGTEVELIHRQLDSDESAENHRQGWVSTMDRLESYLADPMETQIMPSGDQMTVAAQIQQARDLARLGLKRFQRTFEHVPDDKVHWSPTETSKSALRILVHTALANQYFASVLRGDQIPHRTANEVVREIFERETSVTDRQEAEALFQSSMSEVLRSYDLLDINRVATDPKVAFVLTLVGRHADGHASQIDYLQTTWGDLENHFVK